jgi:two-component system cell cycle sensor histidine kinase/response regulator CckA
MDVQAPTKVLIVDDAIGDVILLRALIEEDDHHHVQIDHAGSMDEAFALLQNGTPDIILLDLGLPDSRGLRSVELMLQADADSAIVVLTGLDDEAIAIEAVKMGVQDYWHKDELDSRTVVRGIRYAIERHHAKRELRETQRQLLHAQKMDALGRLAGGVAHDFNNLLMAILGNAELLHEDLADQDQDELVDDILGAGHRGVELTRQLLSFSRSQIAQPEFVDLGTIVEGTVRMIRRILTPQIELVVEIEPGEHRVFIAVAQIEQALVNLAVNARDAMQG